MEGEKEECRKNNHERKKDDKGEEERRREREGKRKLYTGKKREGERRKKTTVRGLGWKVGGVEKERKYGRQRWRKNPHPFYGKVVKKLNQKNFDHVF